MNKDQLSSGDRVQLLPDADQYKGPGSFIVGPNTSAIFIGHGENHAIVQLLGGPQIMWNYDKLKPVLTLDTIHNLRVAREEIRLAIADPMWVGRAEVSKRELKRWHAAINNTIESIES